MSDAGKAPSDLELMLYADGELEGDRLAAVERYLAEDTTPRNKLAGLGLVASYVRDGAHAASSRVDGIADSVMAAIDAEPATRAEPAVTMGPRAAPNPRPAELAEAESASPKVTTLRGHRSRRSRNEGSRSFYVIAAAVVAAAAAVVLWSRPPAAPPHVAEAPKPIAAPSAAVSQAPTPAEPAAEADADHGVEVAAVDFGSRTGAVFYVPSGSAASDTTTVVWLSDDSSGEDK